VSIDGEIGKASIKTELLALAPQLQLMRESDKIAFLIDDLRLRFRSGNVRTEDYLQVFPAVFADDDSAIDLIYSEFMMRDGRNHEVRNEFLSRFPCYEGGLARQFEVFDALASGFGELEVEVGQMAGADEEALQHSVKAPNFELKSKIGEGSFAVVFRARDKTLGRDFAINVMLPSRSQSKT